MNMGTHNLIDWRRLRESRELAGEWRILRAKIRHVVERTCALGEQLAANDDAADAIDIVRQCALDYFAGRPFSVSPFEMMSALGRLFEADAEPPFARAA
jgi:hypothetical protein